MYTTLGKLLTHGEDMLQILCLLMLGKAMQGHIDLPQSAVYKNITTCFQQSAVCCQIHLHFLLITNLQKRFQIWMGQRFSQHMKIYMPGVWLDFSDDM